MQFTKMHGCGNDYVLVDGFRERIDDPSTLARTVSERRWAIGADGVILVLPSASADLRMRIWNADGSEAEMCGNGIRCLARYAFEHRLVEQRAFSVETAAGVRRVRVLAEHGREGLVEVDMGLPVLERAQIPVAGSGERAIGEPIEVAGSSYRFTGVSMGNPHVVLFFDDEPSDAMVRDLGPQIERHEIFPRRANVGFARIIDPGRIRLRVWERGCGETLACGTGACAAVVAGSLTERSGRAALVELPGGTLEIFWAESGRVSMTGPAVEVFRGEWPAGRSVCSSARSCH